MAAPLLGANSKMTRYYSTHHEATTKPYGRQLYRAIARQRIGDPRRWHDIYTAVLHFAIRVRANRQHPYHERYLSLEKSLYKRNLMELFTALDSPGFYAVGEVYEVVGYALGTKLSVATEVSATGAIISAIRSFGPQHGSTAVLLQGCSSPDLGVSYASLIPDTSGKALVEQLLQLKAANFGQLHIKQLSWAWMDPPVLTGTKCAPKVTCFNEWRPESRLNDILGFDPMNRLDTLKVIVTRPQQIRPLVQLIDLALSLAPNQQQDIKVGVSCARGTLKPHMAVDEEFAVVPEELVQDKTSQEASNLVDCGQAERLVSVVTIAIGQHLTIDINILHMLQHASPQTVPELRYLLEETIFNPNCIKLWHNFQLDMTVLDDTIAYMYQGTQRAPFTRQTYFGTRHPVTPIFHFSNKHLLGDRPETLSFPTVPLESQSCDLHAPGVTDRGMSCPCSLNNIDLSSYLDLDCREKGLPAPKRVWTVAKFRLRYNDLVDIFLKHHRLAPLLHHMKNGPKHLQFFQSLGRPGTESNDAAMQYCTIDTIGLNMIFEQRMTSDDRQFVAGILADYAYSRGCVQPGYSLSRNVDQRRSRLGDCGDIPMFDDNPRGFTIDYCSYYMPTQLSALFQPDGSTFATQGMTPWEHDRRAKKARETTKHQAIGTALVKEPIYTSLSPETSQELADRQTSVLHQIADSCDLHVPKIMANIVHRDFPQPILRAGTTTDEELTDFLQSKTADGAAPPPGFKVKLSGSQDVPVGMRWKVPGSDLKAARKIFDAHQSINTIYGGLSNPVRSYNPRRTIQHQLQQASPVQCAANALAYKRTTGFSVYEAIGATIDDFRTLVFQEESINANFGLPSITDISDIFDAEGREYRWRVENAPAWNKPLLQKIPATYKDGSWKSSATETLRILQEMQMARTSAIVAHIRSMSTESQGVRGDHDNSIEQSKVEVFPKRTSDGAGQTTTLTERRYSPNITDAPQSEDRRESTAETGNMDRSETGIAPEVLIEDSHALASVHEDEDEGEDMSWVSGAVAKMRRDTDKERLAKPWDTRRDSAFGRE